MYLVSLIVLIKIINHHLNKITYNYELGLVSYKRDLGQSNVRWLKQNPLGFCYYFFREQPNRFLSPTITKRKFLLSKERDDAASSSIETLILQRSQLRRRMQIVVKSGSIYWTILFFNRFMFLVLFRFYFSIRYW